TISQQWRIETSLSAAWRRARLVHGRKEVPVWATQSDEDALQTARNRDVAALSRINARRSNDGRVTVTCKLAQAITYKYLSHVFQGGSSIQHSEPVIRDN